SEDRDPAGADAVLARQTEEARRFLSDAQRRATILFAYEPVWAIGDKGIPATSDYADDRQARIKRAAAAVLPAEPPVLYGGRVSPGNAAELVARPHVDGLFIGRSAWDSAGYID